MDTSQIRDRALELEHFVIAPDHLLLDQNLSGLDVRVWLLLRTYGRQKDTVFPSNAAISRKLGCHPRTVQSCLKNLEACGWIEREVKVRADGSYHRTVIIQPGGAKLRPPPPRSTDHPPHGAETVRTIGIKNQKKNNHNPQEFDQFWDAYPKRVGKGAARASFAKALEKTDLVTILAAVTRYSLFCDMTRREKQFIANPSTWLNQERWADDSALYEAERSSVPAPLSEDDPEHPANKYGALRRPEEAE